MHASERGALDHAHPETIRPEVPSTFPPLHAPRTLARRLRAHGKRCRAVTLPPRFTRKSPEMSYPSRLRVEWLGKRCRVVTIRSENPTRAAAKRHDSAWVAPSVTNTASPPRARPGRAPRGCLELSKRAAPACAGARHPQDATNVPESKTKSLPLPSGASGTVAKKRRARAVHGMDTECQPG